MKFDDYSFQIIGKALEIHKILGPGLLESSYQECLYYELTNAGFFVEKEKILPLTYKDLKLKKAYRIDLLVDNQIVIETKAVERIIPDHHAQVLTYMKLGNFKTGLLINFNNRILKSGIKRFVL